MALHPVVREALTARIKYYSAAATSEIPKYSSIMMKRCQLLQEALKTGELRTVARKALSDHILHLTFRKSAIGSTQGIRSKREYDKTVRLARKIKILKKTLARNRKPLE